MRRILFFYTEKDACLLEGRFILYKKKNSGIPRVHFVTKLFPQGELQLYYLGIPQFYSKKKNKQWNTGLLLDYIQHCCEEFLADAYYVDENPRMTLLSETPSNAEKRMEDLLLEHFLQKYRKIESVMIIDKQGEVQGLEQLLPDGLLCKLKYFYIITDNQEHFGDVEELLWRDYGMPVQYVREMEDSQIVQAGREMIIDAGFDQVSLKTIRPGSVYIDLWSDLEKRNEIRKQRPDIKYVSEYEYVRTNSPCLDTFQ